ncbi:MAG: hypothetical protein IT481_02405 [Gammaproteobacteria bacterium]|nr:hypothetical protein [Gammaproteobacteria bacterium]
MSASRHEPQPLVLAELGFASQFVVWAARQWIHLRDARGNAARRLADAFEAARAPRALDALDAVLATLACHARRRLDFRAAGEVIVGRDERALLELLGAMQAPRDDLPDATVCDEHAAALVALGWTGDVVARRLAPRLADLAGELAAAGLWLGAGPGLRLCAAAPSEPARRALH